MFVNSAIVPIAVNWSEENLFCEGGLLNNVVNNWLSIAFLQPMLEYFNIVYAFHLMEICKLSCKGKKSKRTQLEANM